MWLDILVEAVAVFYHCLHTVEAGLVERLKDVECSEEEGTGAAGGVEDRYLLDAGIECPQQVRPFAILNYILRKLTYIEVISDKIVSRANFTCFKPSFDFCITFAPCHHLAPGFGRQGILLGCGLVPLGSFGDIL